MTTVVARRLQYIVSHERVFVLLAIHLMLLFCKSQAASNASVLVDDHAITLVGNNSHANMPLEGGMTLDILVNETILGRLGVMQKSQINVCFGTTKNMTFYRSDDCQKIGIFYRCLSPALVGGFERSNLTLSVAFNNNQHFLSSRYKVNFVKPVIERLLNSTNLPLMSSRNVTLQGQNFGPQDGTRIAVYYGPLENRYVYSIDGCSFIASNTVRCPSQPAKSKVSRTKLVWTIELDGQRSKVSNSTETSYAAPIIEMIENNTKLKTNESSIVLIFGKNFGPSNARIVYGWYGTLQYPKYYTARECNVLSNTEIKCASIPVMGNLSRFGLRWTIKIEDQHSAQSFDKSTAYAKPELITIMGKSPFNTLGGDVVSFRGYNFGSRDSNCFCEYRSQFGYKFKGQSCFIIDDKNLRCKLAAGYGKNFTWRIGINNQLANNDLKNYSLQYAVPIIQTVAFGNGNEDCISTRGGNSILIYGNSFGPNRYNHTHFSYASSNAFYSGTNCYTVNDTLIHCLSAPGTGRGFDFTINVGHQVNHLNNKQIVYCKPTILKVFTNSSSGTRLYYNDNATTYENSNSNVIATHGADNVVLVGANFGPNINAYYGAKYQNANLSFSVQCRVIMPHVSALCNTKPGVGKNLKWVITIEGLTSSPSVQSTRYRKPLVAKIHSLSFKAIITRFAIYGSNFGPTGTPVDISFGQKAKKCIKGIDFCYTEVPLEISETCVVTIANRRINCTLPVGVGANMIVAVIIAGQKSENIHNVTISFPPPRIDSVATNGSSTEGGSLITILGKKFGLIGSIIDVFYGPVVHKWKNIMAYKARDCRVLNDTVATCKSSEGTGTNHSWRIIINGQYFDFNLQRMSYLRPTISSVTGKTGLEWSTEGNEDVVIKGNNFGPLLEEKYIEAYYISNVTHRRTYMNNCRMTINHTEITCSTREGTGFHYFFHVIIDGQDSEVSRDYAYYQPPSIGEILPMSAPYNGGTEGFFNITIRGINFGLNAKVYVGSLPCLPIIQQHQRHVCIMQSPGIVGTFPLIITAGNQSSRGDTFLLTKVMDMKPKFGCINGKTPVTLGGESLWNKYSKNKTVLVKFGALNSTMYGKIQNESSIGGLYVPAGTGRVRFIKVSINRMHWQIVPTNFSYFPPPELYSVYPLLLPSSAPASVRLLINGKFFNTNVLTARFNNSIVKCNLKTVETATCSLPKKPLEGPICIDMSEAYDRSYRCSSKPLCNSFFFHTSKPESGALFPKFFNTKILGAKTLKIRMIINYKNLRHSSLTSKNTVADLAHIYPPLLSLNNVIYDNVTSNRLWYTRLLDAASNVPYLMLVNLTHLNLKQNMETNCIHPPRMNIFVNTSVGGRKNLLFYVDKEICINGTNLGIWIKDFNLHLFGVVYVSWNSSANNREVFDAEEMFQAYSKLEKIKNRKAWVFDAEEINKYYFVEDNKYYGSFHLAWAFNGNAQRTVPLRHRSQFQLFRDSSEIGIMFELKLGRFMNREVKFMYVSSNKWSPFQRKPTVGTVTAAIERKNDISVFELYCEHEKYVRQSISISNSKNSTDCLDCILTLSINNRHLYANFDEVQLSCKISFDTAYAFIGTSSGAKTSFVTFRNERKAVNTYRPLGSYFRVRSISGNLRRKNSLGYSSTLKPSQWLRELAAEVFTSANEATAIRLGLNGIKNLSHFTRTLGVINGMDLNSTYIHPKRAPINQNAVITLVNDAFRHVHSGMLIALDTADTVNLEKGQCRKTNATTLKCNLSECQFKIGPVKLSMSFEEDGHDFDLAQQIFFYRIEQFKISLNAIPRNRATNITFYDLRVQENENLNYITLPVDSCQIGQSYLKKVGQQVGTVETTFRVQVNTTGSLEIYCDIYNVKVYMNKSLFIYDPEIYFGEITPALGPVPTYTKPTSFTTIRLSVPINNIAEYIVPSLVFQKQSLTNNVIVVDGIKRIDPIVVPNLDNFPPTISENRNYYTRRRAVYKRFDELDPDQKWPRMFLRCDKSTNALRMIFSITKDDFLDHDVQLQQHLTAVTLTLQFEGGSSVLRYIQDISLSYKLVPYTEALSSTVGVSFIRNKKRDVEFLSTHGLQNILLDSSENNGEVKLKFNFSKSVHLNASFGMILKLERSCVKHNESQENKNVGMLLMRETIENRMYVDQSYLGMLVTNMLPHMEFQVLKQTIEFRLPFDPEDEAKQIKEGKYDIFLSYNGGRDIFKDQNWTFNVMPANAFVEAVSPRVGFARGGTKISIITRNAAQSSKAVVRWEIQRVTQYLGLSYPRSFFIITDALLVSDREFSTNSPSLPKIFESQNEFVTTLDVSFNAQVYTKKDVGLPPTKTFYQFIYLPQPKLISALIARCNASEECNKTNTIEYHSCLRKKICENENETVMQQIGGETVQVTVKDLSYRNDIKCQFKTKTSNEDNILTHTESTWPPLLQEWYNEIGKKSDNEEQDEVLKYKILKFNCIAPSHPIGQMEVSITINDQDYVYGEDYNGNSKPAILEYIGCDAGYSASTYKSGCKMCNLGRYADDGKDCKECVQGQYGDEQASVQCKNCPVNSTTKYSASTEKKQCLCFRGHYMLNESKENACRSCPAYASCSGAWKTPIAKYGFYRNESCKRGGISKRDCESGAFLVCNPRKACNVSGNLSCTEGYTGRLCSKCLNDYFRSNNRCVKCLKPIYFTNVSMYVIIGNYTFYMYCLLVLTSLPCICNSFYAYVLGSIFREKLSCKKKKDEQQSENAETHSGDVQPKNKSDQVAKKVEENEYKSLQEHATRLKELLDITVEEEQDKKRTYYYNRYKFGKNGFLLETLNVILEKMFHLAPRKSGIRISAKDWLYTRACKEGLINENASRKKEICGITYMPHVAETYLLQGRIFEDICHSYEYYSRKTIDQIGYVDEKAEKEQFVKDLCYCVSFVCIGMITLYLLLSFTFVIHLGTLIKFAFYVIGLFGLYFFRTHLTLGMALSYIYNAQLVYIMSQINIDWPSSRGQYVPSIKMFFDTILEYAVNAALYPNFIEAMSAACAQKMPSILDRVTINMLGPYIGVIILCMFAFVNFLIRVCAMLLNAKRRKERCNEIVKRLRRELRRMVEDAKDCLLFLLELSLVFVLNRNAEYLYCTRQPNPAKLKSEIELFTLDMQTSETCYESDVYFVFSMIYVWLYSDIAGYIVMLQKRENSVLESNFSEEHDTISIADTVFLPKYKYWKIVYYFRSVLFIWATQLLDNTFTSAPDSSMEDQLYGVKEQAMMQISFLACFVLLNIYVIVKIRPFRDTKVNDVEILMLAALLILLFRAIFTFSDLFQEQKARATGLTSIVDTITFSFAVFSMFLYPGSKFLQFAMFTTRKTSIDTYVELVDSLQGTRLKEFDVDTEYFRGDWVIQNEKVFVADANFCPRKVFDKGISKKVDELLMASDVFKNSPEEIKEIVKSEIEEGKKYFCSAKDIKAKIDDVFTENGIEEKTITIQFLQNIMDKIEYSIEHDSIPAVPVSYFNYVKQSDKDRNVAEILSKEVRVGDIVKLKGKATPYCVKKVLPARHMDYDKPEVKDFIYLRKLLEAKLSKSKTKVAPKDTKTFSLNKVSATQPATKVSPIEKKIIQEDADDGEMHIEFHITMWRNILNSRMFCCKYTPDYKSKILHMAMDSVDTVYIQNMRKRIQGQTKLKEFAVQDVQSFSRGDHEELHSHHWVELMVAPEAIKLFNRNVETRKSDRSHMWRLHVKSSKKKCNLCYKQRQDSTEKSNKTSVSTTKGKHSIKKRRQKVFCCVNFFKTDTSVQDWKRIKMVWKVDDTVKKLVKRLAKELESEEIKQGTRITLNSAMESFIHKVKSDEAPEISFIPTDLDEIDNERFRDIIRKVEKTNESLYEGIISDNPFATFLGRMKYVLFKKSIKYKSDCIQSTFLLLLTIIFPISLLYGLVREQRRKEVTIDTYTFVPKVACILVLSLTYTFKILYRFFQTNCCRKMDPKKDNKSNPDEINKKIKQLKDLNVNKTSHSEENLARSSKKEKEREKKEQEKRKKEIEEKAKKDRDKTQRRIRQKLTEWLYSIDASMEDIDFLKRLWKRRKEQIINRIKAIKAKIESWKKKRKECPLSPNN